MKRLTLAVGIGLMAFSATAQVQTPTGTAGTRPPVTAGANLVFTWYVKTYGPEVNLFVDHSQIVQLEALRMGLWGTTDMWGRVVTYKPS